MCKNDTIFFNVILTVFAALMWMGLFLLSVFEHIGNIDRRAIGNKRRNYFGRDFCCIGKIDTALLNLAAGNNALYFACSAGFI